MAYNADDTYKTVEKKGDDVEVEIGPAVPVVRMNSVAESPMDEKVAWGSQVDVSTDEIAADLRVTGHDLEEAEEFAKTMSLSQVKKIMQGVLKIHENDPNFPMASIEAAKRFLASYDDIRANPEDKAYSHLVREVFIEAALIANHSPYAEVRAVVSNKDDVDMPASTVRAWFIGVVYVAIGAFINQFFEIRQPRILLQSQVAQLLAHPLGLFLARVLPDWGVHMFGTRITLNPGPWNKKEHMLAVIMANTGFTTPYTNNIIWSQYLPQYYNQSYAGEFAYQFLISVGTNYVGYGMAGLCRRFLVYPTHAVWPTSLVTIALNATLHADQDNEAVPGPFKRMYKMGRMRAFTILFVGMFIYFWIPNMFFNALATFNWISWIAPNNLVLNTIVGSVNGMGLNPIPTFDWNTVTALVDPLVVPFFSVANLTAGMFIFMFPILAVWWTNAWNTAYLPINTNRTFDRFGQFYNVSRAINDQGHFDKESYEAYSPAYMSAANAIVYLAFFAVYSAVFSYAILFHRHEIALGFRNMYHSLPGWKFWKKRDQAEEDESRGYVDLHNRLMSQYPEVSEWWYLATLLVAMVFGICGIALWETFTTPAVVVYGVIMCAVAVVPVGIIYAGSGVEVTLNVLAEFIGGSWVEGNALAMNYFKSFGYVTCAHALAFSSDLKIGHYTKIPPRHTFAAQMVATLVSTFVCVGVLNFQIRQIPNVCTPDAPMRLTCPGINTFFTAAVFWGTLGPHKMFGKNGQYSLTLIGFPIGLVIPIILWWLRRKYPQSSFIRGIHPVALLVGPLNYAPYNLTYQWPALPVAWISMVYLKRRFLSFWARYNYVVSAAFSCGIAISAVIQFFGLQMPEVSFDWWGNEVLYEGCEGVACRLRTLAAGEYFGPGPGEFKG